MSLSGQDITVDAGLVFIEVECVACGSQWDDVYCLTDVVDRDNNSLTRLGYVYHDYLKRGGVFCPFCYSDDIDWGPVEVDSVVWQSASCYACHEEWSDVYFLCGIAYH